MVGYSTAITAVRKRPWRLAMDLFQAHRFLGCHPPQKTNMAMAMGQNPVPPVNIPIPTKIGSKMGDAPYPKMGSPFVLTTTATWAMGQNSTRGPQALAHPFTRASYFGIYMHIHAYTYINIHTYIPGGSSRSKLLEAMAELEVRATAVTLGAVLSCQRGHWPWAIAPWPGSSWLMACLYLSHVLKTWVDEG